MRILSWLILLPVSVLQAQADSASRARNQPVRPFHIIDNVYYIGASDIAIFLIATPNGLIVTDGGYVETAPQILANIRTLGYRPEDVKLLLNSHAHFDHAGGLAELKRVTGARLVAGRGDSAELANGGRDDFWLKDGNPFPAVTVDRAVADGDTVRLGGTSIVAMATPGHTKGCTTWSMTVHDGRREYAALFICSLSVLGPLSDAGVIADYQSSIAKLRRARCDLFLAAHASIFGMDEKRARMEAGAGSAAFLDPAGCRGYIDGAEASLNRQRQ
ncbi:MAG TPA: subclass B3 metallo-beta-lactamase [Gemmatimonadales bacterium]|jgi:metallo-beta-lactamase class B